MSKESNLAIDHQRWAEEAGPHSRLGKFYRRVIETGINTETTDHSGVVHICKVETNYRLDLHAAQDYKDNDMELSEQLISSFTPVLREKEVSDVVLQVEDGLPDEQEAHYRFQLTVGDSEVCTLQSKPIITRYSQIDNEGIHFDGSIKVVIRVPVKTEQSNVDLLTKKALDGYKKGIANIYSDWTVNYSEL